jgi:hypothetical protein
VASGAPSLQMKSVITARIRAAQDREMCAKSRCGAGLPSGGSPEDLFGFVPKCGLWL